MAIKQGQEEDSVEREEDSESLNTITIEPEPERPEEEDDDEEAEERPAQRPSKARRANGYRELKETASKVPDLERQLAETREAMARMQGMFQQDMYQRQSGNNPFKQHEDAVQAAYEEQNRHYEYYVANAAKMSPEDRAKEQRRAQELDRKKAEAQFELVAAQRGYGRQPSPQELANHAFQQQLNMRYPDLVNTRAGQVGMLILQQMLAEGKPNNWDTIDEAADEARRRFGMKTSARAPKPTKETQAKFSALPKGGGSGGGGGGGSVPTKITKNQDKMVAAMYPQLYSENPNKARQKWWNNFGKKSTERRQSSDE